MADNLTLTATNIRYLLAIHALSHGERGVRCVDTADALQVSKPSVHMMMNTLRDLQLIRKDHYGAIFLTDLGRALSARYSRCYDTLSAHFRSLLGGDAELRSVTCAILASLPLEEIERMCHQLSRREYTADTSAYAYTG